MRKSLVVLVTVLMTAGCILTSGCGSRTLTNLAGSSSPGTNAHPATASTPTVLFFPPTVAASPTVDIVLEEATRRAEALDPHAIKVFDSAISAPAAHAKQIPIGPHVQQGRVVGFKGDFPEEGFPGGDSAIHEPYVFFTYSAD